MLHIIPTTNDKLQDTDNIKYIHNINDDSMAKKYNRGIEQFVLNSNEEFICLRHDDTEIRMPEDVCEYKLRNMFKNHDVGCCGLIGCLALHNAGVWWVDRECNGIGAIIQGNIRERKDQYGNTIMQNGQPTYERYEYWMKDQPGIFDEAATVDGCCIFFPRWIFEEGLRFDENLIDYHFYDADICCQVHERGYKVGITDIAVKHESVGAMPPQFDALRQIFISKWTKKIDHWPITRFTKFIKEN